MQTVLQARSNIPKRTTEAQGQPTLALLLISLTSHQLQRTETFASCTAAVIVEQETKQMLIREKCTANVCLQAAQLIICSVLSNV